MHHDNVAIPRRVLAYARVSGQAQGTHGTSLEGQDEDARRLCRERGYPAPLIFVEVEGGGAEKDEKRTEQLRLMASIQPGDLVLCSKQDRWSRSTLHFLASTAAIIDKGARFFSIAERFDPSTAEGKFASTIMAAVAEQEHARIKDRTVGTRQRLRAAGDHVEGLPPMGYAVERRRLVIELQGAAVVRRLFALVIEGHSLREASVIILREYPGTVGMDSAGIARRLKDRRYLGESNTIGAKRGGPRGTWNATHEAIVDRATWTAAERAVASRRMGGRPASGESRNVDFLLRGVVRCGSCGTLMSAHDPGPTVSVTHGGYYQCPHRRLTGPVDKRCDGPRARYRDVDVQVGAAVLAHLETLTTDLAKPHRAIPVPKAVDYDGERAKLLKRRERLIDAIAEGVIEHADAKTKLDVIANNIDEVDRKRAAAEVPAPVVDRVQLLAHVDQIRKGWQGMTVAERREVVRMLTDRVSLLSIEAPRWTRGAWTLDVTWRKLD
jgi:DNA invertase Pin-like site-specific DNA recombinase